MKSMPFPEKINGQYDILELLILPPDSKTKLIFRELLNPSANLNLIQTLIEAGANLDYKESFNVNDTPLNLNVVHCACFMDNIEAIKLFINGGANINSRDEHGNTPLIYAVKKESIEIVKYLIKSSANVNIENNLKETPIFYALQPSRTEILKLLIKAKSNLNHQNEDGFTPLHKATQYDLDYIVELLIKKGANPNIQSELGLTPLHLAALDEFCDITYTLLWYGANTDIQDYEGDTPLHIAHDNCSEITIQHLLDFEADITIKNNKDISYEDVMKYDSNDDDIDE